MYTEVAPKGTTSEIDEYKGTRVRSIIFSIFENYHHESFIMDIVAWSQVTVVAHQGELVSSVEVSSYV